MSFVLDASVTLSWCFEDEATPQADAVLALLATESASVPPLWIAEIANVLLVAERRRRLTEFQSGRFVSLLAGLPIRVESAANEPARLIELGRHHQLSAYDASYLALAEHLGVPLATGDQKLTAAAKKAGVPLVGMG